MGMCHSPISKADQGHYALRVYLRVWLNKKKECVEGGVSGAVLKKASGHRGVIMADLSKMELVWFTEHL